MADAISRLGVVVEEKGIQETLRGLDKLIVLMERAEKAVSKSLSPSVDLSVIDKAADRKARAAEKEKAADDALARAKEKQESYTSEVKAREAEKRKTIAENEAERQKTIEAKSSAERSKIVEQYGERARAYNSKTQDDILKINARSEADLAKIKEASGAKLKVMQEASLSRMEEAEKRAAANVSAIQQKEREKRLTDSLRYEQRAALESAKNTAKSEQLADRSNAQIMAIRERTAAFAEKMHLREQAAAERSLKAQQQGVISLSQLSQGLQGLLTFSFAGFGIGQLVSDLIKSADTMTELTSRLKMVTSTTAELSRVQQALYVNSQLSGTRLKDNSEIYFGLARSTRLLGISQKDLITLTDGLGKAAIVSGASTESYKSAMVQLRQALESGVLRGQEFNSVNEQAPRIMQAIAEGLGKTTGELRKMAGEGKLTTDVVIPALMTGLKKVDDEYEKLPKTVSRGWNVIENSFLNWVDKANRATGSTSSLSSAMFSLSKSMDSVSGEQILSSIDLISKAFTGLAVIVGGRLIGSFIAARVAQLESIAANVQKVKSDKAAAIESANVARQNMLRAESEMVAATAARTAAAQEVAAAQSGTQAYVRLTEAKAALVLATERQILAAEQSTVAAAANRNAQLALAEATTAAAASTTAAGVAMTRLRAVFSAIGGWVTIAIGVIWGLVTIWDKVANSAENAAQAQRDAVQAAKGAQSRSEVNDQLAPYLKQQQQLRDDIQRAEAIGAKADASTAKGKQQIANVERYVNSKRAQLVGVTSTVQQLENIGKDKTDTLTRQVQQGLSDQRTPEQIAQSYKDAAKYKTPEEKRAAEREEARTRRDTALSAIGNAEAVDPAIRRFNQGILSDPEKLKKTANQIGITEAELRKRLTASSSTSARASIEATYQSELKAINAKDKSKGAAARTPRPELSAGFEVGLNYTKEELDLITKLASAQEKLLGYIVPETLARKQALEMTVEQENTQTKIAKIQEQLSKKNLGVGVRESLQATLKAYQDRGNAVSQELAVTQALAREQNSLKQYQQETLIPAKQALELEKARNDYAVATGEMSSEESQKQARLNDLRLIELEYAGQVAEAQKTFNELQKAGYEEAAKNSQKRLEALVKERDQKLEIAKIKIAQEEDAKTLEAGWKRAWQKYKDEAADASKLTEKLMTSVVKSVEDALFNMMSGVKVSFSDLFKSIMNDLKRYLAQQMTKEIGDAILGKSSDNKGGLSSLFGGSKSGDGKSGRGGDILGTLGTIGTVAKSYGSEILSWMGENTGSTTLSGWGASLSGAGADAATDAAASIASDLGNSASSASSAAGSMANVASYAMVASNVFNSIKTGKGWGATVGSMASLIPGIGPIAGAVGSVLGGLVDSVFGSKGGPKSGGNYNAAFTSTGQVVEENMFGGYTPSELDAQMQAAVKGLQSDYTGLVKSLGGEVKDLTINLGGDQDPNGTAGNRVSAQIAIGNIGTGMNNDGDAERALWGASLYSSVSKGVGNFEEAIKLETARMLVAAVKASDLPQEIANSLNAVDLNTASQAQLDAIIARVKELAAVLELFKKWQNVFPNFISASNDAKIALVELSGGIENFSGMLSSYYDNFYSDAEKAGRTWVELTDALHEAGVTTIPRTRAEYRKLVESVEINTESGRELYNTLLQLAPAFASVTDAATIADNQLRDNLEKARQAVQDAYDRESGEIRTAIDRLGQFADAIRKFRDSLYLDEELSPLSNYDKYQFARSKLEDTQQKALAGDEEALAQLEQASRDFLEYSRVYNANNAQYQTDFDSVQSFLSQVEVNTRKQRDSLQAQLDAMNKMVEGIINVNTSVLSLKDALTAFAAAKQALGVSTYSDKGNTAAAMATDLKSTIEGAYETVLGRKADSEGLAYWTNMVESGALAATDFISAFTAAAKTYTGTSDATAAATWNSLHGSHADGLDRVPFDGYRAELHKDEMVLTKRQAQQYRESYMSPQQYGPAANDALVAEVKQLRKCVEELKTQNADDSRLDRQQRATIADATLNSDASVKRELVRVAAKGI